MPLLHKAIMRVPPVVVQPEAESAIFTFNALSATGTALLFAGFLAGVVLGLKPLQIVKVYGPPRIHEGKERERTAETARRS